MSAQYILLIICGSLLINTIANVYLLRKTARAFHDVESVVSVIVPMRNEAGNVKELIEVLGSQIGLKNVTFHLIDDNSTDETSQIAKELTINDGRFFLHHAPPLKAGWLGKLAAMQYGLSKSTSDIVVFIDADVRLEKDALARGIASLKNLELDFISAYPKQDAITWSETLIQPLLQWSWMATVPLRISEKSSNPAFCVANGQFFFVDRLVLDKIDGLERIRGAVLDDIFLARELVRSGFHGTVIDGSKVARCRMYSSWSELREGYGKSLHIAFGGIFGTLVAIILFLITGILPLVLTFFGSKIGFAAFLTMTLSRALSALTCRGKVWSAILHPLSMLLLIYLILRSWAYRKSVQWKGRTL